MLKPSEIIRMAMNHPSYLANSEEYKQAALEHWKGVVNVLFVEYVKINAK